MQWLAMITMLVDHVGIVFYPDNIIWRIIGRVAFPLYAYGIVTGLNLTQDRRRYVRRLAVIGAAAQIPYMLALNSVQINVIGTFLVVIATLWLADRYKSKLGQGLILLLAAVVLDLLPFDYGSYALMLILIYRHLEGKRMVAAHAALNVAYWIYAGWMVQLASIISTVAIASNTQLLRRIKRPPRWLWLSYYPAHLTTLFVINLALRI